MIKRTETKVDLLWDRLVLIVMLFALLVRLWFLYTTSDIGRGFGFDEKEYFQIATSLAEGKGYGAAPGATWINPPLYLFFLAAIFKLFGPNVFVVKLFQVMLDTLSVGLIYLLGKQIFSAKAGFVAALVASLWVPFIALAVRLMSEIPYIFLLLLAFLALTRFQSAHSPKGYLVLGGGFLGLATLTRPFPLGFLPFIYIWLFLALKRDLKLSFLYFGLVLIGCFMVILPWTTRNYLAYQRFVLIDTEGGRLLWIDNEYDMTIEEIDAELSQFENPADRQGYAIRRAMGNIIREPFRLIEKAKKAAKNFWGHPYAAYEKHLVESDFGHTSLWHFVLVTLMRYGVVILVFLLAILGFIYASDNPLNLLSLTWVGYSFLMGIIFHPEPRFRLPLEPLVILYASNFLASRFKVAKSVRRASIALSLCSLYLFVVFPTFPIQQISQGIARRHHTDLAEHYWLQGKTGRAVAEYEKAIEIDPHYARGYVALGNIFRNLGMIDEAITEYERAIEINSYDFRAYVYLSDIFRSQGRLGEATAILKSAKAPGGYLSEEETLTWAWDHLPTPQVDLVDVGTIGDLGYVRGFHAGERWDEITFRWTRGQGYVKFPLVREEGGTSLTLSLRLAGWRPKNAPSPQLSIVINGQNLANFIPEESFRTYQFVIPEGVILENNLTVEIHSNTFIPKSLDSSSTDDRELGVVVDWVRIEDAETTNPY